jgi:radical SAM protein with 4Fe4S-binding SPASM domain
MGKEEFYFQWHFINRCNLRCAHCYQENYVVDDLPLEKLLGIAGQISTALKKWNMLGRISLTGGEPFLSPHLPNLVNYLENDPSIKQFDILTNGTCITQRHVDMLKQSRKLHQIQISIDGATERSHDAVRGLGTFKTVLQAIKRLKESDLEVSFMFTLMKQNKDDAIQVIDFAEACGVNAITIERVTPCGHSNISDLLTTEEVKKIYEAVTLRANYASEDLTVRRLRPLWINTAHLNANPKNKIGGFCPAGFTSLAILWDGTVLPCRRLDIPIGNILTEGLFKIWYDSDILWEIRDKSNLKGKCSDCKNVERCGGCRAIAYETTGDYMGEDTQCWI